MLSLTADVTARGTRTPYAESREFTVPASAVFPDKDGNTQAVWVVEEGGELYLRAHFEGAKWLTRIRNQPEVELRRGEAMQSFFAGPVDDPEVRRAVNRAMAEKYGLTDRLASAVWDPEKSIPVHLLRNDASAQRP